MAKITIKLPRNVWLYDTDHRLGKPGGFGIVYEGYDLSGTKLAVKKLTIDSEQLASREVKISNSLIEKEYEHVLPYYDAGIDAETGDYFIVMAFAQTSLAQALTGGQITTKESAEICLEIAIGLNEVPNIVHRDLKPANILNHNGKWKIADFGIAKFIEESTSANTLRDFLSDPYAAPEQWLLESPTNATDVYALGSIYYQMIFGKTPFLGPSREDYRNQHLNQTPAFPKEATAREKNYLLSMLRKKPIVRPSINSVIKMFKDLATESKTNSENDHPHPLEEAGVIAAQSIASQEAIQAERQRLQEERTEIAKISRETFQEIRSQLALYINEYAPASESLYSSNGYQIRLDNGSIYIKEYDDFDFVKWGNLKKSGWDILHGSLITVRQQGLPVHIFSQQSAYYGWQGNLFFSKFDKQSEYRWWEVAFFSPSHNEYVGGEYALPFGMGTYLDQSTLDNYLCGTGIARFAYNPIPIDGVDINKFFLRWSELLAKAVKRELQPPRYLPIPNYEK